MNCTVGLEFRLNFSFDAVIKSFMAVMLLYHMPTCDEILKLQAQFDHFL